jgi:hypothetical protein
MCSGTRTKRGGLAPGIISRFMRIVFVKTEESVREIQYP